MSGAALPPGIEALWTAVACVDRTGSYVAANRSYASMLGTAPERVVGRPVIDFAGRAENQAFFDGLEMTFRDGEQRRVRHHSRDHGRVFDTVFTQAGEFVVVEVADVTDEVREHERRLQIQSARDVIWERVVEYFVIVDLVEREVIASPGVWARWPIDRLEESVRGGFILDALGSEHRWDDPWPDENALFDGRVQRAIAEVYTTGEEQRHRNSIPLPGGQARYFDTHLVPWRVADEVRGVVIISHDQTDLLRTREQRSLAEEAMAQLLADLPVSVWEVDLDGPTIRPLFADRRTPAMPTWGQPAPLSTYLDTLDASSRARLTATLADLRPEGRAALRVVSGDLDRHGQVSLHHVTPSALDGRRRVLMVVTDVTSEVGEAEAQSRFDHATHVMRFAQGVAHDFGNVAQVVGGYSELLSRSSDPRVVEQASSHLASAARRAVSVSKRIATIARVQQVINGPLDISDVIHDCAVDLRGQLGEGIDLVVDAGDDLIGIGERSQISSMLENLCQNAAQAMHGAGRVAIRARQITRRGREYIEVVVADTGPGIPDELLGRVFDPFVTGRPDAGTGLGLYLIQEYLYSVRGEIEVESSAEGATFHLLFPAVA